MLEYYFENHGDNHYLRIVGEIELISKGLNEDDKFEINCKIFELIHKLKTMEEKGLATRVYDYRSDWDLEEIGGMRSYLAEDTDIWD